MRTGNLLFSAVQLIFVIALFLLGGLLIGLGFAPHLRFNIADIILKGSSGFAFAGYVVVSCASILLCGFYAMNRGVFYQVRMGSSRTEVDTEVLRSYIQGYWQEIFPEGKFSTEVLVHKNQKIEILAEIPDYSLEDQKVLLSQIEKELGHLLKRNLGYHKELLLTLLVR